MNTAIKYTVQLITEADKLTEALSLRYRTYKKAYPKYLENSIRPYESDAFDSRSIHLRLYCESGTEKKLAGYCRLILPQCNEKDFSNLLLKHHQEYLKSMQKETYEKLSLIERIPVKDCKTINSFCKSLETEGIIYAETSRFIIDEEHRSISLSFFFVSSMIAVCKSVNITYNFFTCSHHHSSFYKKFGLCLFEGIAPFENEIFGTRHVIFGTDLNVANRQQASILKLKRQLEMEDRITFKKVA